MTLRSHQSASSKPPATAGPATAAITGFDSSRRDGPIGPRDAGPPSSGKSSAFSGSGLPARLAASLRSQPAQKAPPAPQNTATDASGSRSKARNASVSASALSTSMALRASGREWMTVVTGPLFSIVTVMDMLLSRSGEPERRSPLVMIPHQPVEQADAPARGPALVGLGLEGVHGRAGDVEMDPRGVA